MKECFMTTSNRFVTTVEVVPPAGFDPDPLLTRLGALEGLAFDGFSVATNPVAKPCMSAMALCSLIQARTGKPAVLHCTTRDHNRLGLQGLLWGARALGIDTVMAATGDMVALGDRKTTSTVGDLNVFEIISMGVQSGMDTGAVFDSHPEVDGFDVAVERLKRKIDAGAGFVVTQPVYDRESAERIARATRDMGVPVILGILPLRTLKHARFLHDRVAGIAVPETVRSQMAAAADTVAEGAANAREMLTFARETFAGACIMPPFDHYEVLHDIIG
ncbi:MAG: methylenetetrahydrofolate reductase [Desulfobacterium sp.]|nr:methylenetetrahydrofolate reductase [Desulfobacterium sp.]